MNSESNGAAATERDGDGGTECGGKPARRGLAVAFLLTLLSFLV